MYVSGGQSPLHLAAGSGSNQAVRVLLEHGANAALEDLDGMLMNLHLVICMARHVVHLH